MRTPCDVTRNVTRNTLRFDDHVTHYTTFAGRAIPRTYAKASIGTARARCWGMNANTRTVNITSKESHRDGSKSFALVALPGADSLTWADDLGGTVIKDDYMPNDRHGRATKRLICVDLPVGAVIVWLEKAADGTVTKSAVEMTADNGDLSPKGAVKASTIDDLVPLASSVVRVSARTRQYIDTITRLDGTTTTYRTI